MKIIVDADACPVVGIVERLAKENKIPVILLCDTSHIMNSTYSKVITVAKGTDAVDFKIITVGMKGDLVVTQDYGVAAMALGKGMLAIHQSGMEYTQNNIDRLLFERHMAKAVRLGHTGKGRKTHIKGPSKRTNEDDFEFEKSLKALLDRIKDTF